MKFNNNNSDTHHNLDYHANDAVFFIDSNFRIIEWNKAQEELTGIKKAESLNKLAWDVLDRLTPERNKTRRSKTALKNTIQANYKNKVDSKPILLDIQSGDETIKHIRQNYFFLKKNDIDYLGFTSIDLTHLIDENEKLQQSDNYLDFLTNTAIDLFQCKTLIELYEYAAKKIYELFGSEGLITVSEFDLHKNTWRIAAYQGLNETFQKISRLIGFDVTKMEGEIDNEYYQNLKEGELTEIKHSFNFLTNGQVSLRAEAILVKALRHKGTYVISFKEDDTVLGCMTFILNHKSKTPNKLLVESFMKQVSVHIKKKNAENKLALSEGKYKAIVENSYDGIYIYAGERFLFINGKASELSGYSDEEFHALKVWEFIHPDDRQRVYELGEKRAEGIAASSNYEARVICKNGEIKECEFTVTSINFNNKVAVLGVVRDIGERKKNRLALVESEAKYKTIFEAANVGITLTDKKGKFYSANEAVTRVVGYSLDELMLMKDVDLYKEKWHWQTLMTELEIHDQVTNFQTEIKHKHGQNLWISINAKKVNIQGKELIFTFSSDITEQKKTQQALLDSEERYKTVIEKNFDGIFIYKQRNILFANHKSFELTGYSQDDINKYDIFDLIHKDDLANVKEIHKKRLLGETAPANYEARIICKNGDQLDCEFIISNITYKGEQAFIGVVRNITDQKKYLNEIRKLSTAVTQSPTVIMITDINGCLEYANPILEDITGYKVEELIGERVSVLSSGILDKNYYSNIWKKISSGETWRGEFINKKKNGDIYWESASISPILDNDGKIINFIKVAEDITEKKNTEQALQLVAKSFVKLSGKDLYTNIAGYLSQAFNTDYAYLGEINSEGTGIDIIGGVGHGKIMEPFSYQIANTPSESILGKTTRFYPKNVQELFPDDQLLGKLNIESFMGAPLFSNNNKNALGLIVLMHSKPLNIKKEAEIIFAIFADRITAEIERLRSNNKLEEYKNNLEDLIQNRTRQLEEKNKQLARMNDVFVGREFRVKELKDHIKSLKDQLDNKSE